MFYMTNITSNPAWVTTSNGDSYNFYPPVAGFPDAGVSIYVDPNVPAADQNLRFMGNAQGAGETGSIYVPKGQVKFYANGGSYTVGTVVADTVQIVGSTTLNDDSGGFSETGVSGIGLVE
jgi:hypothetical protein